MLTFSVNQEYNEAFRGVYFLRNLLSFSSSNLKVSIYKKKKKAGIIDCPPLYAYHFTI